MKGFLRSKLILSMIALIVMGGIFAVPLAHISHAQAAPTMTLHPASGTPGTVVIVTGSGWTPGRIVDIRFGNSGPSIATPTVASDGTFSTTITIPSNAALGPLSINADEAGVNAAANFTVTPIPTPVPTPIPPQAKDCKEDHTLPQTCAKQISKDTGTDLAGDLVDRLGKVDKGVLCLLAIRAALVPYAMLAVIVYDSNCTDTLSEGAVQGYYLVLCISNSICRDQLIHHPLGS